jgi:glyoxylase I family protein
VIRSEGFHHLALQAADVERVAAFYREVLDLPELYRYLHDDGTLRSIWLGVTQGQSEARGGFLAIEAHLPGAQGTVGLSMVAFRISRGQREEAVAHLKASGVPIEKETGWTLYFRDPEGNLVGLSHHPDDQV